MPTLINREKYVQETLAFANTDLVKVVTGIRRCGKSSLLQLVQDRLESMAHPQDAFLSLNLEQLELGIDTGEKLHDYCMSRASKKGRTYIFIDEVQNIEGWHSAINSLRVSLDCDLYVTGSNAFLMSSDIATYLSGRYVEIRMLPLAFNEYIDFCKVKPTENKDFFEQADGSPILSSSLFERYMAYGGMPGIANLELTQQMHHSYMASLYESVVQRDVLQRGSSQALQPVSNEALLRSLCAFLSDNIGNMTSPNKLAETLTSFGTSVTNKTVQSYINALIGAFVVYPCKRFDLHGKKILKTNGKYYLVDTGLRTYLDDYRNSDSGRVLENLVHLHLLYRGFSVHVGKLYSKEVDFVAKNDGKIVYIQVADNLYSPETMERELAPLRAIGDNHEKLIVVRQGSYPAEIDGIKIVAAVDFCLSSNIQ